MTLATSGAVLVVTWAPKIHVGGPPTRGNSLCFRVGEAKSDARNDDTHVPPNRPKRLNYRMLVVHQHGIGAPK